MQAKQQYAVVPYSMDGIGGECVAQDESPFGMTDRQVGEALGYTDPDKGIQNVIARNLEELSEPGLSTTLKLRAVDGKQRNMRVWTKEGVVRVSFLASTEKSRVVRSVAAKLFVAVSEGKATSNNPVNRIRDAKTVLKDSLAIMGMVGKIMGIDAPTQLLAAAKKTREETGVDVMSEFDVLLPAPKNVHSLMTPTEIGQLLNPPIGPRAVNDLLQGMDLQSKAEIPGKEKWEWVGNPDKQEFWHRLMVEGNGARFPLRWYDTVVPLIVEHLNSVKEG